MAASVSIMRNMGNTEQREALAPWWHTVLLVVALGALSVASRYQGGFISLHVPGISERLSRYITVLSVEWLLVLAIWFPLRQRGRTLSSVVSGRWTSVGAFFRDLALGIAFFIAVAIPISLLANRFAGQARSTASLAMLPKTWVEVGFWVLLSATAGFCEELLFRGYFSEQFKAWTGSATVAIIGQAVLFALGHGYYNGGTMVAVMLLGVALGLLAHWRKSLRPGMLGHGLTDAIGGVAAFFGAK